MTAPVVAMVVAVLTLGALHPGAVHPRRRPGGGAPPTTCPRWLVDALAATGSAVDAKAAWTGLRRGAVPVLAVVALALNPAAAIGLATMVALAPRLTRQVVRRRLADRRDAQLPMALERLASGLRAGQGAGPALAAVAETTGAPLGIELRAITAEIAHGAGIGQAVDRWAERSDATPAVRLAAAAMTLGIDAGGEMARSLDRVAATVRERRQLTAEAHALATQARASAVVLCGAPVAFTVLVSSVEPGVPQFLFATPAGLACLVAGAALDAAGATWMARIVRAAS